MDVLPTLLSYTWRSMRASDAARLARFERACAVVDGDSHFLGERGWVQRLQDPQYLQQFSLLAINTADDIAAAAYIHFQEETFEVQAFLDGRVHPMMRQQRLGSAVLSWMEQRAALHLGRKANGRPQVLRIMFYDRKQDAIELFEASSYRYQYSEDELVYDLNGPLPPGVFPDDTHFTNWNEGNALHFYEVYRDAFRTRTDNLWDEAAWRQHFANPDDGEFLLEISLIVYHNEGPIAYTVCHADTAPTGTMPEDVWISQLGVCPEWRRRGIAVALLAETHLQMALSGVQRCVISVNVNNPGARQLYINTGYQLLKRFTLYRKELASS